MLKEFLSRYSADTYACALWHTNARLGHVPLRNVLSCIHPASNTLRGDLATELESELEAMQRSRKQQTAECTATDNFRVARMNLTLTGLRRVPVREKTAEVAVAPVLANASRSSNRATLCQSVVVPVGDTASALLSIAIDVKQQTPSQSPQPAAATTSDAVVLQPNAVLPGSVLAANAVPCADGKAESKTVSTQTRHETYIQYYHARNHEFWSGDSGSRYLFVLTPDAPLVPDCSGSLFI